MELKKIYNILDDEIQNKYKTKVECAKNMGISRQKLNHILNTLKNQKEISFNRIDELLNFFGYEIQIKKRG